MENRRAHVRFRAAVAAEIIRGDETLTAETRDISAGGVAVLLPEPLREGSRVSLLLILTQDGIEDANEEPFEAAASVMWSAPTESGHVMVGLRFVNVAPTQRQRLERFLSALHSAGA
jgi:c-di-GMP-binding flagellar brake protein YcgR